MDFSYWIKSVGSKNCDAITKADKPKTTNGLLFLYEAAKDIELKSPEMSYEERLVLGFVLPEKEINKSVSTKAFDPKSSKRKPKIRNQPQNALATPQKSQLNNSFRIHRQNIKRLRKEQRINLKRPRFSRSNMHLNEDCSFVDIGPTHQERLDQLISQLENYIRIS